MVGGARVLLLAVLLAAAAPGAAAAASSNAASTHTYIVAAYAFGRASEGRMGVIRKAIQTRERALLRQCPRAAAGSPQNEESYKLSYEAAGALWAAGYGADAGPIATFVRQTRGLHWTSAKTNRAFASFVDGLHGLSKLPSPSLCKDIATWKTSGFTVVPATTVSFDKHVESLEAKPVASQLLAPYAQGADRALLAQAQRIATKLLNFETQVGGDAWYALTEGLELNP
jgi:hypothetical protein